MPWAFFAMRVVIGAVFVFTGAVKLMDPAAFADAIERYKIIGPGLSVAAARFLPWIEMVAGAALVAGLFTRGAAVCIASMNVLFAGAIFSVLARQISTDCGCGLPGEGEVTWIHVAGNIVMLIACVAVAQYGIDPLRADRALAARVSCCPGLFGTSDSTHR